MSSSFGHGQSTGFTTQSNVLCRVPISLRMARLQAHLRRAQVATAVNRGAVRAPLLGWTRTLMLVVLLMAA